MYVSHYFVSSCLFFFTPSTHPSPQCYTDATFSNQLCLLFWCNNFNDYSTQLWEAVLALVARSHTVQTLSVTTVAVPITTL